MPVTQFNSFLRKLAVFIPMVLISANTFGAKNPVTISENETSFTLDNGIIAAQVAKSSGDLISLRYKNHELLEAGSGHSFGYWSHDASHGEHITRVTINPKTNGGERGEVSVKGVYAPDVSGENSGRFRGGTACDIEIRYTLARGLSGIYTYSIFDHQTNDPATGIGEARFAVKLDPNIFDYLNVDANRRKVMLTPADWLAGTQMNFLEARRLNTGIYKGQVEHKYDYSANQFDTRVYGWLGTKSHIGLWFINPSVEYLSGGPTKYELTGHLDISEKAAPVLLNYWRSSHYGGAICAIANGEKWSKVIGPFLIYCNSAKTPDAMWRDALKRTDKETKSWPYDWVSGVDYPHKNERATVQGQLILNDLQAAEKKLHHLLVGLTAPDYSPPQPVNRRFQNINRLEGDITNEGNSITNAAGNFERRSGRERFRGGFGRFRGPRIVDWQNDAKHYEFWTRGDRRGHFEIPNVRPGTYTLHAIADGVLGEFTLTNVTIGAGKKLNLGKLNWQPVRFGKQLWDIGIPNRTGAEFFKGDDYYHWGWYLKYAKLFPNDINYVIGKSDFHKDWFFEQVPHNENPNNTNGLGRGRSTTWSITFDLPDAPQGRAILRLAICGVGARSIAATVNGQSIGSVTGLVYNATINRDGIGGYWTEHDLIFDATLMKSGKNVMRLTIPEGSLTSGIIYDYLRLELNESATPSAASANRIK